MASPKLPRFTSVRAENVRHQYALVRGHQEFVEMCQGTLQRQLRRRLVVARRTVAIKGVTGTRIGEDGKARILMPHLFDHALRNVIVIETKVKDGRDR